MKRFHVHAHVEDLQASVAFYSRLFAAEPARLEADYAKWMLDDPRVNFAISTRGGKVGVDHLGFQTDTEPELAELKARAQRPTWPCSRKVPSAAATRAAPSTGSSDPQGIAWEQFHTLANIPVFSERPEGGRSVCVLRDDRRERAGVQGSGQTEPPAAEAVAR